MMKKVAIWGIPPLALVGLGISAYLVYVYYSGAPLACLGGGKGCKIVEASPYSKIGPIPVALVGLAGYAAILTLSLGPLWNPPSSSTNIWTYAPLLTFGAALVGLMYSIYLTYLELYVIYAICTWCVASAVVMALIFLLSLANLKASGTA